MAQLQPPPLGHEYGLCLKKPDFTDEMETDLDAKLRAIGAQVIKVKTFKFLEVPSADPTHSNYLGSSLCFYRGAYHRRSLPADVWANFELNNETQSYNCSGPTTALLVVGPLGTRRELREFMRELQGRHDHPHPYPYFHVSQEGYARNTPLNAPRETFFDQQYECVWEGVLQDLTPVPVPAPTPAPPAQPMVQPVAPPAPPPVVRVAPPAPAPVVQAPAPAPLQDADSELMSALGEQRAGAILTFANGTRGRVDVRGLDEPSRTAVRDWADRRGGFTTASREVPGKGTVLQIKRITPERAAAPAPPPAKKQRREPAPEPEPAPAPAPAPAPVPHVSDAVDAGAWKCFCTTDNKAEAMECWVCGLRRP
jgi:hypothetical protein